METNMEQNTNNFTQLKEELSKKEKELVQIREKCQQLMANSFLNLIAMNKTWFLETYGSQEVCGAVFYNIENVITINEDSCVTNCQFFSIKKIDGMFKVFLNKTCNTQCFKFFDSNNRYGKFDCLFAIKESEYNLVKKLFQDKDIFTQIKENEFEESKLLSDLIEKYIYQPNKDLVDKQSYDVKNEIKRLKEDIEAKKREDYTNEFLNHHPIGQYLIIGSPKYRNNCELTRIIHFGKCTKVSELGQIEFEDGIEFEVNPDGIVNRIGKSNHGFLNYFPYIACPELLEGIDVYGDCYHVISEENYKRLSMDIISIIKGDINKIVLEKYY